MGDIDNIKSYLESDDFKNRLKTFIAEGAYFTKEGNYNTLIDFVPDKKKEKIFGFSFPDEHNYNKKWNDKDFSSAIELFISLLQNEKKAAEYIKNICNGNIENYCDGTDIFRVIANKFAIKIGTYTNNKGTQQTQSWSQAISTALCEDSTLKFPAAGKEPPKHCASYYNSALSVANNIHNSKSETIDKPLKDTINPFLLNTYVGLCFILNKIKGAAPKSPTPSESSFSSNTSEGSNAKQDNKPETPIEDKQTRKGGNADIPEPNQGERNLKLNENEKQTEGGITPNPELGTELTNAAPEKPKKAADVNGENQKDDNTKSPNDDKKVGFNSVDANGKGGASSSTLSPDKRKTDSSDEEEPNTEGQGDENDGAGSENKNDLPVLSREAILEKLERYEAIYRTFYFDELKSFLTKVNFNGRHVKEGVPNDYDYLYPFVKIQDEGRKKYYNSIIEDLGSKQNLNKNEKDALDKAKRNLNKKPYSQEKEWGFNSMPIDTHIIIAIETFFDLLRKDENEGLANFVTTILSWYLSDINGHEPDYSFCLKYGETFLAKILEHFGCDNISFEDDVMTENDSFACLIKKYKDYVCDKNEYRSCYANVLNILRIIRNTDVHIVTTSIPPKHWNRTIRFIIHTFIGACYAANRSKNVNDAYKKEKAKIIKFPIKYDGEGNLVVVNQNLKKIRFNVNLEKDSQNELKYIELDNFQYYSFSWNGKNIKKYIVWNCADVEITLCQGKVPHINLNTRFAEFLTAYIREKFNVGVRLDSMEGSIAEITRLMNGDEKDGRSIKSLLLAVLDKVEILGKEKSNVQEHINEFSEQLNGISQALREQPEKITEGVISGIKDMDLPADITKSIMERIDPKLDRLVETTDNIKGDTATIKEDTTEVKHSVDEIKKITEESAKTLSEIEKDLKNKSSQGEPANISDGNVAPASHIQIGDNFTGTIIVGNNNGGNKGSGNDTPTPPIPTLSPVPEQPHTSGNGGGSEIDTKLLFVILAALLIVGIAVVLLLGKGSSVEQNVTVITGTEQVAEPKTGDGKPSDGPNTTVKPGNPGEESGQGAGGKTPPPVQPPTPNPQPKVDANYEAGMAAYNAGEGLEAIKKFQASGSADANYMLGIIYENGCGSIAANQMKARDYYKKAKNLGSEKAKAKL